MQGKIIFYLAAFLTGIILSMILIQSCGPLPDIFGLRSHLQPSARDSTIIRMVPYPVVLDPVVIHDTTERVRRVVHYVQADSSRDSALIAERDSLAQILRLRETSVHRTLDSITAAGDTIHVDVDDLGRGIMVQFRPAPRMVLVPETIRTVTLQRRWGLAVSGGAGYDPFMQRATACITVGASFIIFP